MNGIIGLGFIGVLLYLGFIGFSIFMMVLYVKLALRGIKALDIYIDKNRNNRDL